MTRHNQNTRLLYDGMHYLEENNKTGLLLLVDFEKAFDSIEWLFLKKALNSFNLLVNAAEAILISVFKRLIGRQLPIYCLSFPSLGMQVITL
jgi:hypothetical protein